MTRGSPVQVGKERGQRVAACEVGVAIRARRARRGGPTTQRRHGARPARSRHPTSACRRAATSTDPSPADSSRTQRERVEQQQALGLGVARRGRRRRASTRQEPGRARRGARATPTRAARDGARGGDAITSIHGWYGTSETLRCSARAARSCPARALHARACATSAVFPMPASPAMSTVCTPGRSAGALRARRRSRVSSSRAAEEPEHRVVRRRRASRDGSGTVPGDRPPAPRSPRPRRPGSGDPSARARPPRRTSGSRGGRPSRAPPRSRGSGRRPRRAQARGFDDRIAEVVAVVLGDLARAHADPDREAARRRVGCGCSTPCCIPTAQAMARLGLVNDTISPSPRFFTSTPPVAWIARTQQPEVRLAKRRRPLRRSARRRDRGRLDEVGEQHRRDDR